MQELDVLKAKVVKCFEAAATATGCTVSEEKDFLLLDMAFETKLAKWFTSLVV